MRTVASVALVLVCASAIGLCGDEPPGINLREGTISGKFYAEYTLDEITDMLGRPNSSVAPKHLKFTSSEYFFGVELKYHDLGLQLTFEHPSVDPQQHLLYVNVFLVPTDDSHHSSKLTRREWDDTPAALYSVFFGALYPQVDADTKFKAIIAHYAERGPELLYRSVIVNLGTHTLVYVFDRNTGFVEEVVIDPPHDEDD